MKRLLFFLGLVLACSGFTTISEASGVGFPFTFEVRIPKTATPDIKTTRVIYVANHDAKAALLWVCKQREEAGNLIFQRELLIVPEDKPRRGLIIQTPPAPSQVFLLSIPVDPKPEDWSQWQRPNYVETGDTVGSFFWSDSQATGRSTNLPPVCFEVRYKIGPKRIE